MTPLDFFPHFDTSIIGANGKLARFCKGGGSVPPPPKPPKPPKAPKLELPPPPPVPKPPPPPPPAASYQSETTDGAANAAQSQAKKRDGYRKTILASETGGTNAATGKKTLLGG